MNARNLNTQLPPITRLWQGDMANMEFQVKIFVVDPIRLIQGQGNRRQFAAKDGGAVQAPFQRVKNIFEPNLAAFRSPLIVNGNAPDMHGEAIEFDVLHDDGIFSLRELQR